jgi:hypothetical protein
MDRVISETEAIGYVKLLYRIEQDPGHDQATVLMGPFTAFTVIGALQLAMRNPDFSAEQARLVQGFIDQLKPLFAGTAGELLLGLGDEPAFDVPAGCRYPEGPHDPACGPGDHPAFR